MADTNTGGRAALLVVEDDAMQRKMMQRLLDQHFALTVCDQFEAAELDWCDFDAILLDVMMPVHDGPWLVRQAAARCVDMPAVIFYSALPLELLRQEAAKLADVAAVYYLGKAGRHAALIDTLLALCAY